MEVIHFRIFRRVDPSTNKTAEQSLSKTQNELNMKKVYVNSRVKAMISFLETLSNIVYVIVIYFTVRTSFATLFIHISLYMIILPYAFLMNTSHNKEQVIEHGWVCVFKNVVKKPGEKKCSKVFGLVKIGDNKSSNRLHKKAAQDIFVTSSSSDNKFLSKNSTRIYIIDTTNNLYKKHHWRPYPFAIILT